MSQRSFYLDVSPGETRGVVCLEGQPERLLIRREGEDERLQLGARLVARVASFEAALATAFLDLGGGREAILPLKSGARPVRGQVLEVEIRTEPRQNKHAVARRLGAGEGPPRLLASAPDLASELREMARAGEIIEGGQARDMADLAEFEVLETVHPLPGGGTIAIEPTRALVAVDIDLGQRSGGESKRVARQANLAALGTIARLLRLKALGGIIVIDLIGRGHDGAALMSAARAAFGPDNPGVAIGPVGRLGTMELSIPRRRRPLAEVLCRPDGAVSDRSLAQRLVRQLEREAQAQPGAQLLAVCAPAVAESVAPFVAKLAARFGARFTIRPDAAVERERMDVALK